MKRIEDAWIYKTVLAIVEFLVHSKIWFYTFHVTKTEKWEGKQILKIPSNVHFGNKQLCEVSRLSPKRKEHSLKNS